MSDNLSAQGIASGAMWSCQRTVCGNFIAGGTLANMIRCAAENTCLVADSGDANSADANSGDDKVSSGKSRNSIGSPHC
jgi:hypothetical protein